MELIELPIKEQLERPAVGRGLRGQVRGSLEHTPVKGPMAHEKPKRRADKVMVDGPIEATDDSSARRRRRCAAVERANGRG